MVLFTLLRQGPWNSHFLFSLTHRCYIPKLVKIGLNVPGNRLKMFKCLRPTHKERKQLAIGQVSDSSEPNRFVLYLLQFEYKGPRLGGRLIHLLSYAWNQLPELPRSPSPAECHTAQQIGRKCLVQTEPPVETSLENRKSSLQLVIHVLFGHRCFFLLKLK